MGILFELLRVHNKFTKCRITKKSATSGAFILEKLKKSNLRLMCTTSREMEKLMDFTSATYCEHAKDSKDTGGIHDFVEILKLYDKNEDNTILGNELFRLLTNLGEKLTKEEAKNLMKELCDPEDDEGFMPFMP